MNHNIVNFIKNRETNIKNNTKLYYFYCVNCSQKFRFEYPNYIQLKIGVCSQNCYNMINYKEYHNKLLALI